MTDWIRTGAIIFWGTILALFCIDALFGLPTFMSLFPAGPGLNGGPLPIFNTRYRDEVWISVAWFVGGALLGATLKLLYYYFRR